MTLEEIYEANRIRKDRGRLADYIPELAKVSLEDLALSVIDGDRIRNYGDCHRKFTLQSVSKIVALAYVLEDIGLEGLRQKIDIKPTEDAFNKFYRMDLLNVKKPSNPMINLGAIGTTGLIEGPRKVEKLLDLIREMTQNQDIDYNRQVYSSEKATGFRNMSMAYLLKEVGTIDDPEVTLDNYFKQCSIEVTVEDLSKIGYVFMSHGKRYGDGKRIISRETARIVNSVMATSGMYNYSGEYAASVGIPSKSGVSGAILGVVPGRASIGVYSPGLDEFGNSKLGIGIMEDLAEEFNYSIF